MPAPAPLTAPAVLDKVFLEVRAKLLEIGASLDRIERSDEADAALRDARMQQLRKGLEILLGRGFDRAEKIQMLFSDAYEPNWSKKPAGGNGKK